MIKINGLNEECFLFLAWSNKYRLKYHLISIVSIQNKDDKGEVIFCILIKGIRNFKLMSFTCTIGKLYSQKWAYY